MMEDRGSKKVQFVINDHMTRYLRAWSTFGFPYSKKALQLTGGNAEIVFPMRRWFNEDWSVNEVAYERAKKQNLLKNLGSFHALMEFHPTIRQYSVDFDDDNQRTRNIELIKAQILLASRLGKDWNGTKTIVFHPGTSGKPRSEDYIESMVNCFGPCLALADENNVQIAFEPDLGSGKRYFHGSSAHYNNVVHLIQKLTDISPRNRLNLPVALTFDFSHTYIEAEGNYDTIHGIIREYGSYISYAHINHPVRIRGKKIMKPVVNDAISSYSGFKVLKIFLSTTHDGHNPIYRVPDRDKFIKTLELLRDKTRIPDFGRLNLEVGTRWDRLHNFWRSGASGYGTYKSLMLLDQIFNG